MQQVIQNSSSIQICQIAIITSNAGTQTTSNYFQIWNAAGSVQYGGNSSSVNFLQAEGGGVTRTFTWSSNYPNPTGDYVIRIIPSIDSEHSWCMITDGTVYIDTNYDLWRNGIDLNNDATFKIYTLQ